MKQHSQLPFLNANFSLLRNVVFSKKVDIVQYEWKCCQLMQNFAISMECTTTTLISVWTQWSSSTDPLGSNTSIDGPTSVLGLGHLRIPACSRNYAFSRGTGERQNATTNQSKTKFMLFVCLKWNVVKLSGGQLARNERTTSVSNFLRRLLWNFARGFQDEDNKITHLRVLTEVRNYS